MLYTKNSEPQLSMELFRNPTSEYRGTPFWSWNCKVTRELIRSQTRREFMDVLLDTIRELGEDDDNE